MNTDLMQDMSFEVAPTIAADISLRECMDIIKDAVANQKDSNEGIQKALVACSAVAFNEEYHKRNVSPFTQLVEGLRGTDRQTIIKWIEGHAPALWREGKNGTKRFQWNASFKGEFDAALLFSEKWYDLVPPTRKLQSTIDFREQIDNLVKRLTRELESGTKEVKHPECLKELKALQGRLSMAEVKV